MKTKLSIIVAIVSVSAGAFISLAVNPPRQRGADILHYTVRSSMTNESALTNATGLVIASQNQQGQANNQRLDIVVKQLETNATYQLHALLGDDVSFTFLTDFTTDSKGRATLRYKKVGSSNGQSQGKGKLPLPDTLDPISGINELAITDVSAQPILTADLTAPDKLMYLKKCFLSQGGVTAALRIHATTNVLQFRLRTWGLAPGATYFLAADGSVVDSGSSDTTGFLQFTNLPVVPASVINLHAVSVQDSASTTVISAPLP